MDVKEMITKAVDTIKNDKTLLSQFTSEPVKTIEKVLGVDLPDEVIEKVVAAVKSKLGGEGGEGAGGILDSIKKLF